MKSLKVISDFILEILMIKKKQKKPLEVGEIDSNPPPKKEKSAKEAKQNKIQIKEDSYDGIGDHFIVAKQAVSINRSLSFHRGLSIFLCFIIFLLVIVLVLFSIQRKPQDKFFIKNSNGQLYGIEPLNAPNLTMAEVKNFAARRLVDMFSMDYVNYEYIIEKTQSYLTHDSFKFYTNYLYKKGGMIDQIRNSRLVSYAYVDTSKEKVINHGIPPHSDKYSWQIQMPLTISFSNGSNDNTASTSYMATVIIEKTDSVYSDFPLSISNILMPTTDTYNSTKY